MSGLRDLADRLPAPVRRALSRAWRRWRPLPKPPVLPVTLVVPVWNDAPGLERLLAQLAPLRLFAEVVVVDDGSDPALPAPAPLPGSSLHLIRHDRPQGGGVARNAGLAVARQPWLMFLDADDLIAPDLPDLLADLAAEVAADRPFDLCLFKHADSRVAAEGRWGQPAWDEALWSRAGHSVGALVPLHEGAGPILAQTVNYPWNKVYRTAFLRERGLGCGATAVHQDIALHWGALVAAERMLVSDRIGVWHGVDVAGAATPRLTDRRGEERLQVFAALDLALPGVAAAGPIWQVAYAAFALDLLDWVAGRIDPALTPRLQAAEAIWMRDRIAPWLPAIAAREPALAVQLRARIAAP